MRNRISWDLYPGTSDPTNLSAEYFFEDYLIKGSLFHLILVLLSASDANFDQFITLYENIGLITGSLG